MNRWPHIVSSHSQDKIAQAVSDPTWQEFRTSLKSLPTTEKLIALDEYLLASPDDRVVKCRVDNYINALKRAGQLTLDGRVQS